MKDAHKGIKPKTHSTDPISQAPEPRGESDAGGPFMADTDVMVDATEASIGVLLTRSKKRGYLTWEEMNEILPDEAISPDKLELVMLRLEEHGVEMVDEAEADRLGMKEDAKDARKKAEEEEEEGLDLEKAIEEASSRRIDDPVRMYLTQMGEIPLLQRSEEIHLAKKIELTRMAFRKKVLESDFCATQAAEILRKVESGEYPFERTMKISTGEQLAK